MKPASFDYEECVIEFLNQTHLPDYETFDHVRVNEQEFLIWAIQSLAVRGAPLLGLIGAWGAVQIRKEYGFSDEADAWLKYLREARPTAVNLSYGVDLVAAADSFEEAAQVASLFEKDNESAHYEMAVLSFEIIQSQNLRKPLFICNAGQLATGAEYGSSTGGWKLAYESNHPYLPICLETRPLLQGSRLTAWEFEKLEITHYVTLDSNAANLLRDGSVDSVWMGADRISSDGHVINKVGSFSLATLAAGFNIPVYVVAPISTWDYSLVLGSGSSSHVPIEQRSPDEIAPWIKNHPMHHELYLNPAFDVVPPDLVTEIVSA